MAIPRDSEGAGPSASAAAKVARVALIVNAVLHSTGMVGFFVGVDPHAAPLARRATAAGVAGVVMMVLVARRLARDPGLIVLPMLFVAGNLAASIVDLAGGDRKAIGSGVAETLFLVLYGAFAVARARARGAVPRVS